MTIEDQLYPEIEPYDARRIAVDAPHVLHVEQCGNPDGLPALFLHGGPGGGAKPFQRRSFDPARFRVVLFDQRGCGRSEPSAELAGNETAALIRDIETIRVELGIERWLVTGGSWGSLLALAYAGAHPERCLGLRLHGVFLGSPDETRFWFHGIGRFFPEAFAEFEGHVPQDERGDLLAAYRRRLTDDDPAVQAAAAQALRRFSARTQTLLPSAAHVNALTRPRAALEIARIFTHYCANGFFMPEGRALAGVAKLRHLPCEIVQGRYDVVTPPRAAWRLAQAWPEARLTVVDLASHVATPEAPALSAAIRAATDRLADRLGASGDAPTVEDWLAPRACKAPALSDDGALLAFVSDETGFDQLWTMDLAAGGPPTQPLALSECVGAVAFRPGSRDILFTTDVGGDERHQLHLLAGGAAAARALTADPRRVHAWGCFDAAGGRVAFARNAPDPRSMRVVVMDLATGAERVVLEGPGWRQPMSFHPDGRLLVQDNRGGMYDAGLDLLDVETGAVTALLPRGAGRHVAAARWSDGGARLMLAMDDGAGFHGLAALDLATGALDWLSRPEGDVELLALGKGGAQAACAVNANGFTRIVLRDMASGVEREVPTPFPGRATALAFTPDGAALIAAQAGFSRPSAILRLDLAGGEPTVLAQGAPPPAGAVEPSLAHVESFDGAQVPVFVFEPAGPVPPGGRPALAMVHGGPESQYAAHWRSDVQHLVRRGWLVVAPNVRGSTGYGRDWQAGDDLEKRMDSVRDLKAVRDWLAARPDVDAGRLVVAGQSYGGFMVLAAITEHPQDWRAAVDFYGIADFNNLMATTGPWRRALRAVEYGDPDTEAGRALLAALSPMRKVDRIETPLFIAHGLDDPRVTPSESEMLFSALRGLGRDVELVRVPHAGHGFTRLGDRRAVYGAMMRFLETRLR